MMNANSQLLPIVVLISGNGSNLQAIIDAIDNNLPVTIKAVISNRADAYGLERARRAHIPTHVISHQSHESRQAFEHKLAQQIDRYLPKMIVLAGFMRCLSAAFVARYPGRMLNIHPSLLPKFPGLNTFTHALEAHETHHGASIHYVTEEVDGGPLICQARFAIAPDDTADSLKQRTQTLEHQMYPEVLRWLATGRLTLCGREVWLDGKKLPSSGLTLTL